MAIGLILLARGVSDDGMEAEPSASAEVDHNPLNLTAALQMTVLFQVVLSLVSLADAYFGDAGLYASAGVLGLTDVDALTISMAERTATGTAVNVAASALVLGILANTVVKTLIAGVVGRGRFRTFATLGLAAMAASLGAWLILTL